jgi:hypothetical protein
MSFLNNVFVEFDRENKRVGFAASTCATGDFTERVATVSAPTLIESPSSCVYKGHMRCPGDPPRFSTTFWICIGCAAVFFVITAYYGVSGFLIRRKRKAREGEGTYTIPPGLAGSDGSGGGHRVQHPDWEGDGADSDDALLVGEDEDDEMLRIDDLLMYGG